MLGVHCSDGLRYVVVLMLSYSNILRVCNKYEHYAFKSYASSHQLQYVLLFLHFKN